MWDIKILKKNNIEIIIEKYYMDFNFVIQIKIIKDLNKKIL